MRLKAQECQKHMDELSGSRETAHQLQESRDEVTTLSGKVKGTRASLESGEGRVASEPPGP